MTITIEELRLLQAEIPTQTFGVEIDHQQECDMIETANRLQGAWNNATSDEQREQAFRAMLALTAQMQISVCLLNKLMQKIVKNERDQS